MKSHLALACFALAFTAGCATHSVKAPMVQYHEPSYQTKVYRAEHWNEMAQALASKVTAARPNATVSVAAESHSNNSFLNAYTDLVAAQLSAKGLKSNAATPDLRITIRTYCLSYAPVGRSPDEIRQLAGVAVPFSALGLAIGSLHDHFTAHDGAAYGAGIGALVDMWAYDTNQSSFWGGLIARVNSTFTGNETGAEDAEIVVSTTVQASDGTSEKYAQIVYIQPDDIALYASEPRYALVHN